MRPAMIIDLRKCVRCYACVSACLRENIFRLNGEDVLFPPVENIIELSRTRPLNIVDKNVLTTRILTQCMQCENPPCAKVCPTGASFITEENVVLTDATRCIQCGLCIEACPYGARQRAVFPYEGSPQHRYALKTGVPDACTLCYHRKTGEGLWTPACVEACAFGARVFGDLDDPKDRVSILVKSGVAAPVRPELETSPKLFYVVDKSVDLGKYPLPAPRMPRTDFELWNLFKDAFAKPLTYALAAIAFVFGVAHIVKERGAKKVSKKEMEKNE